ncbi:MAG: EscU/YscU/HrcU family type III secretion system export apparatus switch protein [Planctomycetes bacterium]|nr:EscU/YscU/HrcU family type III secretion system export apparatus switch protein [Planctomycetota bacterium]
MPDADFAERTEPATPHKRREARERGQVSKSQELITAAVLLAAFAALGIWGERSTAGLAEVTRGIFSSIGDERLGSGEVVAIAGRTIREAALLAAPLLAAAFIAAFAANVLQVGFVISGHPIAPDLTRLDPIRGFRRILSRRGLFRTAMGIMKLGVVGAVLWFVLSGLFDPSSERNPFALLAASPHGAEALARGSVVRMGLIASAVLLALAMADLAFQRWQYERDLRMTKQEVREELRRLEGDPRIRERRRRAMHQIMRARMLQDARKADVVITNPTEVAVALAYEDRRDGAPRVVAKGEGDLARRIREVAMEERIPIVERPPLARAIYRAVEVGAEIPPAFYRAVAEVLAYVWKIGGRRKRPIGA